MPKVGLIELVAIDMQKYAKQHGISIPPEIYNSKLIYQQAPIGYDNLDIPLIHSLILGSAKIINPKLAATYITNKKNKLDLIRLYQATFSDSRNLEIEIQPFVELVYTLNEDELDDFLLNQYELVRDQSKTTLSTKKSKSSDSSSSNGKEKEGKYSTFGTVFSLDKKIHLPSLPPSHSTLQTETSQTGPIVLQDKHTSPPSSVSKGSVSPFGEGLYSNKSDHSDEFEETEVLPNSSAGTINISRDCRWFTPITIPDDLKESEVPLSDLSIPIIDKLCDAISRSLTSERLKTLKKANVLSSLLTSNLGHFKAHHFDKDDPLYYDTLHVLAYHAGLQQGVKEGRISSSQNEDTTIASLSKEISELKIQLKEVLAYLKDKPMIPSSIQYSEMSAMKAEITGLKNLISNQTEGEISKPTQSTGTPLLNPSYFGTPTDLKGSGGSSTTGQPKTQHPDPYQPSPTDIFSPVYTTSKSIPSYSSSLPSGSSVVDNDDDIFCHY